MLRDFPRLRHGGLYTLILEDGTLLPLVARRTSSRSPWQFIDTCLGSDLCVHTRHVHLCASLDGSLQVPDGDDLPSYELDVRAVAEGLTVYDLEPHNRMAIALYRAKGSARYPCPRCDAAFGERHHPLCFAENLVPLFPMYDRLSWSDAADVEPF